MPSRLLVFLFFSKEMKLPVLDGGQVLKWKVHSVACDTQSWLLPSIHNYYLPPHTKHQRGEEKKSNCNFLRNGSNDAEHVPFFSDVATTVLHTTREVAFRITFPFNWAVFILKPQTSSSFLKYSSFRQSVDVLSFGTTNFLRDFSGKKYTRKNLSDQSFVSYFYSSLQMAKCVESNYCLCFLLSGYHGKGYIALCFKSYCLWTRRKKIGS